MRDIDFFIRRDNIDDQVLSALESFGPDIDENNNIVIIANILSNIVDAVLLLAQVIQEYPSPNAD